MRSFLNFYTYIHLPSVLKELLLGKNSEMIEEIFNQQSKISIRERTSCISLYASLLSAGAKKGRKKGSRDGILRAR